MEGGGSGKEEEARVKVSKMGAKERRKVESLGWLTESSVMPKKQRAIAGVGASSIVELRAELYKSQEDVKKAKETGVDLDALRSRKKIGVIDKKNVGVEERAARDALHLKGVDEGTSSYAALEKKAELYGKLARGELPEEEAEKYNVDFFRKGFLEDERQEMEAAASGDFQKEDHETSDKELQDKHIQRAWVRDGVTGLAPAHKQIIREVNLETKDAREKTSTLKQQRLLQEQRKREMLRQQYIKRQLEKIKAQRQREAVSSGDHESSATASGA